MLAKDRPVLEDDNEFYVQDLIGMKVTHSSFSLWVYFGIAFDSHLVTFEP